MRSRCVRHTKFPVGTVSVPNRLQSLPSHPVARRQRGKRDDLLQCFEFFETVSLLWYHHDRPCAWLPPSEGRSHSAVSSTHFWLLDTTQRFGGPGIFFPVAAIPVSTATRHLRHEQLFVRSVHLPGCQRLLASALRLQHRISRFHISRHRLGMLGRRRQRKSGNEAWYRVDEANRKFVGVDDEE